MEDDPLGQTANIILWKTFSLLTQFVLRSVGRLDNQVSSQAGGRLEHNRGALGFYSIPSSHPVPLAHGTCLPWSRILLQLPDEWRSSPPKRWTFSSLPTRPRKTSSPGTSCSGTDFESPGQEQAGTTLLTRRSTSESYGM